MALVFKIKHKETLRRWVVSQALPQAPSDLSVSFCELLLKVRELFHFSENEVLVITYVDKEGDVVTIAGDHDLEDACFVQGLNPLRLDVETLETGRKSVSASESIANCSSNETSLLTRFDKNVNGEGTSRPPFPQATAEAVKQFLAKCTQNIDPNLQPAVLISHIRKALKDLVKTLVHEGQKLSPRGGQQPISKCPAYSPCANQSVSSDGVEQVVHFGIRCDGCNCHPIRGLRYKSKKDFNYDLCNTCFLKMGNEVDYERIEKPRACQCSFHPFVENGKRVSMKWMNPFASGSDGWKSECPFLQIPLHYPVDSSKKYDASFVKTFSNIEGEEVSPGTSFTMTLCLKNNGSVPWPQGTSLVHVGGDKLALEERVVLQLPEGGLSTGLESNVPVDMKAPSLGGNYISHWCLMAPDGDKFGHSVWLAVQVVGVRKNDSSQSQDASGMDEIVQSKEECGKPEQKIEHIEGFKETDPPMTQSKELGSGMASEGNTMAKQFSEPGQFIVSGFKDDENSGYPSDEVDGFSLVEKPGDGKNYNMVNAPLITSGLAPPQPVSVIDEQYDMRMTPDDIHQEVNLHELEVMGFNNRNLNVFLLEKNKQDLQLTLDYLLLGSGWDNLLKDLQEMGFDDANTNLRLLIKNGGSIKRVVKELVELEKGESGVLLA